MEKAKPPFDPIKEFEKLLRSYHRRQIWRVFADFCEISALTLSQTLHQDPAREARYLKLIGTYEPDEIAVFPKLLACVIDGLGEECQVDFLGTMFMRLELGSHWHGQFFTPMALCSTIAEMTLDGGAEELIRQRGFLTISEPACGAGAMVIAAAGALLRKGWNPHQHMHATAVDVDPTAAHMAYIQFSLLGIPAIVVIGNTLTMEVRETWRTQQHWLGFWDSKIRRSTTHPLVAGLEAIGEMAAEDAPPVAAEVAAPPRGQMTLF